MLFCEHPVEIQIKTLKKNIKRISDEIKELEKELEQTDETDEKEAIKEEIALKKELMFAKIGRLKREYNIEYKPK